MEIKRMSLRKGVLYAVSEYTQWICDAKVWCLFVALGVFLYTFVVDPLLKAAREMNTQIGILEPFTALGVSGTVMLILPLVFLGMMSEYPRIYDGQIFSVIRIGRINWVIGQALFGIFSVVTYILGIAVIAIVPIMGRVKWTLSWSDVATKYLCTFPERKGDFVVDLLPENLYNQMGIGRAAVLTYLLLGGYLFLLLMIMLVFTLYDVRNIGFVLSGGIVVVGAAACSLWADWRWLFPMAHSVVWVHYTKYFREQVFSLANSCLYFVLFIIILLLLAWNQGENYEYK